MILENYFCPSYALYMRVYLSVSLDLLPRLWAQQLAFIVLLIIVFVRNSAHVALTVQQLSF